MRRKYVKYYEPAGRDAGGKQIFRYTGPQFLFARTGAALRGFKAALLALSAHSVLLFVAAGFVGNEGTRMLYIALPYAASLLPAALAMPGAWALWKLPERFSLPEERRSVGRLRACAAAQLALWTMAAIGEGFFISRGAASAREWLFLALSVLAALAALSILRRLARNPARAEPPDAPPLNRKGP